MDNKQRIHIKTLNFYIQPYKKYQWYQWVVKRNPHSYLQETKKKNMENLGNKTTSVN